MSEQKRYTAQEMRDTAQCLHYNSPTKLTIEAAAILRQAADAEEENAKLRVDADLYKGASENWERKYRSAEARLEAVVKECETEKSKWIPAMEYDSVVKRSSMVDRYDRILRAARGEGGAE